MTLKVNVKQWNELTRSAYFANWNEKALKVNEDIGTLPTHAENCCHTWLIRNAKGFRPLVNFGFSDDGEFCAHVITRKYKDPQKKIFSASEVEEIMLGVVNAVGAFFKAGILDGVDEQCIHTTEE